MIRGMDTIKRWASHSKWLVWAILAIALVFVVMLVAPFFTTQRRVTPRARRSPGRPGRASKDTDIETVPEVPAVLQATLDVVHEQAATAKAEAKATSEAQRAQLTTIRSIDDGAERRKRLAEFVRGL